MLNVPIIKDNIVRGQQTPVAEIEGDEIFTHLKDYPHLHPEIFKKATVKSVTHIAIGGMQTSLDVRRSSHGTLARRGSKITHPFPHGDRRGTTFELICNRGRKSSTGSLQLRISTRATSRGSRAT